MFRLQSKNHLKSILCGLTLTSGLVFSQFAVGERSSVEIVEVQSPPMVPAVRDIMPIYPKSMLNKGKAGFVTLSYEIDRRGKAHNFRVIDAEPTRVFVRSAKIALKKSQFAVTKMEGRPVKVRNQQRSYIYSLGTPPYVAAVN